MERIKNMLDQLDLEISQNRFQSTAEEEEYREWLDGLNASNDVYEERKLEQMFGEEAF